MLSDHLVELLSNLVVLLTVIAGVWKTSREANRATQAADKAANQGKVNETKIQDLHNTVNGSLEAARADTLIASDRLLKESTKAARAEGVIEGKEDRQ